jgi:hypothetical protein
MKRLFGIDVYVTDLTGVAAVSFNVYKLSVVVAAIFVALTEFGNWYRHIVGLISTRK